MKFGGEINQDSQTTYRHQFTMVDLRGPLILEETGFGWRVSRSLPGIRLSVDSSQPHSGSRSLLMSFSRRFKSKRLQQFHNWISLNRQHTIVSASRQRPRTLSLAGCPWL